LYSYYKPVPRKLVSTEIHLNLKSYYRKDVTAAGDEAEIDPVNLTVRSVLRLAPNNTAELQPVS